MTSDKHPKSKLVLILPIALLILTGCVSTSKYSEDGIPNSKYRIGGGDAYAGIASKNGTFVLVEGTTKRIIATGRVSKGDPLKYEMREDEITKDEKGFEEMYGIPYSEARFSAYLIPGS